MSAVFSGQIEQSYLNFSNFCLHSTWNKLCEKIPHKKCGNKDHLVSYLSFFFPVFNGYGPLSPRRSLWRGSTRFIPFEGEGTYNNLVCNFCTVQNQQ